MGDVKSLTLGCSSRKGVEIFVLCLATLLLWSFQCLPVIFYNMPAKYTRNSSENKIESDAVECSNPHLYGQDGICFLHLRDVFYSHNCQLSQNDTILASRNNEQMARILLTNFNMLNPSPECVAAILPFYCLYLFGLCDGAGELVQPTRDQCEDIQLVTCAREWRSAAQLGVNLPECNSLPSTQNVTCLSYSYLTSESSGSILPSTNSPILRCQEHFMYDQSLRACVANCHTWNWNDDVTTTTLQVILLCTYLIGITLSIIVLVISGIRYKSMFQIPSVFLVYTTGDIIVFGIVFSYCVIQLQFWWFFHVSIMLWGISLPFHYQKIKKTKMMTYIYILLTVVGVVLPAIPIISTTSRFASLRTELQNMVFISGGIGYTAFTWPILFCAQFNINDMMHAFILPIEILLAIGGPFLFVAFYIPYKNHKKFGTAEKKLLMMFSYYLLIVLLVIGTFTWVAHVDSAAKEAIKDYFLCESGGYNPKQPCRKEHRDYSYAVLTAVTMATFALYPIYVLIVVVSTKDLKRVIHKYKSFSLKETSSK